MTKQEAVALADVLCPTQPLDQESYKTVFNGPHGCKWTIHVQADAEGGVVIDQKVTQEGLTADSDHLYLQPVSVKKVIGDVAKAAYGAAKFAEDRQPLNLDNLELTRIEAMTEWGEGKAAIGFGGYTPQPPLYTDVVDDPRATQPSEFRPLDFRPAPVPEDLREREAAAHLKRRALPRILPGNDSFDELIDLEISEELKDTICGYEFSQAMQGKMAAKRGEGRSGWYTVSAEEIARQLAQHISKGDPLDIANYAMMLYFLPGGPEALAKLQVIESPKDGALAEAL